MWNNENYNSKFGPKQVNNIIIIDIYSNFKKWFFFISKHSQNLQGYVPVS